MVRVERLIELTAIGKSKQRIEKYKFPEGFYIIPLSHHGCIEGFFFD